MLRTQMHLQSATHQQQLVPRTTVTHVGESSGGAKPKTIRNRRKGAGERKKKWAPRAKTGCMTCRIRRVKCDETRPSCSQCISTKRKCDGYANSPQPQHVVIGLVKSPDYSHSPPGVQLGQFESRMFHMFRNETVKHVAGVFDHSFWKVNVLRAARIYPAIWHASLAVAAMQERNIIHAHSQNQDIKRKFYGFALLQYNAAIKILLEIAQKSTQSVAEQETLLMASLLFTTLSILQSDGSQAITHANNGIQLFYRWRYWEQAEHARRTGDRILSPDFFATIVAVATSQFHYDRSTISPWSLRNLSKRVECTGEFESASDAFIHLEPLLTGMMEILNGLNPDTNQIQQLQLIHEKQRSYRDDFLIWKEKYARLQQCKLLSEEDSWAMIQIKALSIGVDVALHLSLDDLDMEFDEFYSSFEKIVKLTETLLETEDQGPTQWGYSFSHSISMLLFFVSTSCRDSALRRRAITLLRSIPDKTSYIYSKLTARLCESIMEAEEIGQTEMEGDGQCCCVAGEFICREHRAVFRDTQVVGYGQIVVSIRTVADLKRNRPGRIAQLSFS
ncbi:hypothetical protein NLG97_g1906 [Lecanicillium saksenae]|uniref:Uncharacterized protein n=1 Tax=Lecanicillium saksenae TaxID=468837 RepID=A0ACC1R3U1_9HYPO|nr:hypothetical protein NLG97_g1906 [Lecanicillium saksenae]